MATGFTFGKRLVKAVFKAAGLEIRRKRSGVPRASMRGALRQLAALRFRPSTVIDAGVAFQTSELYEEFSDSNILLIEPLQEFEPCLQEICKRYKAQYVLAAAGETTGAAVFNVHKDHSMAPVF
jgi:hypothetical protein